MSMSNRRPTFVMEEGSKVYVSRTFGKWQDGNMSYRLCSEYNDVCGCRECRITVAEANISKVCPAVNLRNYCRLIGVKRLTIATNLRPDGVGFDGEEETAISRLAGCSETRRSLDAYFTNRKVALGGLLGDCVFIAVEIPEKRAHGYVHISRPNMQGPGFFRFERNGKPVDSLTYYLGAAVDHFRCSIADVHIRICSVLEKGDLKYVFASEDKMEEYFPGWLTAGFMYSSDKSSLRPEQVFSERGVFCPDIPGMLKLFIENSGIPSENVTWKDPIRAVVGGHASHTLFTNGMQPCPARDAYIIVPSA